MEYPIIQIVQILLPLIYLLVLNINRPNYCRLNCFNILVITFIMQNINQIDDLETGLNITFRIDNK